MRAAAFVAACAIALAGGCAVSPGHNPRIEEAIGAHALLRGDATVAALAPAQAQSANDALERAVAAWHSREDPALVDHLAYVAGQRARIAVETARRVAAERTLAGSYQRTSAAR